MPRKLTTSILLGAAALALTAGSAWSQTLSLATDAAGTTYNAVGSGFAKVITENSDARVIVRPFGGPDAYMDQMNSGELNLSTFSSSTAFVAYHGKSRSKKEYKNIRLLMAGQGGLFVGFSTMADSGIKSIKDIKGKRVASDYGGHAVIGKSIAGAMATAGLTWADVTPVPVTGANDGIHALDAGRVDVAWASLGQPVVRELNAAKGVRYLTVENSPESLAILRKNVFPGANLVQVKKNDDLGVRENIYLINYDAYLVGNDKLSDKDVKTVLEAVWANTDKLTKIHRALQGFVHDAAVSSVPMIPYHPAAVAFYKEKGIWTKDAEMANAKFN